MVLKNNNPTEIEKQMFIEYGLYPIDIDPVSIRYIVCKHCESIKEYPTIVNMEEEDIDYNNSVLFEIMSECIIFNGHTDMNFLSILTQRAKELGYGRIITLGRKKI